ncbi:MAG: hypothetical protein LBB18_01165, partial [Puniceicoccales bacterium]|nr:hypothetical protein [Puniceicoccales bacterium]
MIRILPFFLFLMALGNISTAPESFAVESTGMSTTPLAMRLKISPYIDAIAPALPDVPTAATLDT